MDLTTIYLGDRLGYYRALVDMGGATPAELATRTGTNERYMREWLEQQAVTDILDVEDSGDPATRRYALPAGHDLALTDRDSLAYVAPLAKQALGMTTVLPTLVEAYRTGGGVPYADYGADVRDSFAEATQVMFINLPASEWLPALPDIHARLRDTERPARVADIGCGSGWSTIAIAQGYPADRVDGIDAEEPSAATGTVMRADTLRAYATEARFTSVEVLPIENEVWRFYRLTA